MNKIPVSAIIITKNEEKKVSRCLNSLTWVDEIIVVDAFSSDETVKICENPALPWAGKTKVLKRQWTGFRDQRMYALNQAKNDWLLVMDADEMCSNELESKIKSFFDNDQTPPHRAYKVHRVEYFLGKPIRYGIWNPSYQDRFFHREGVTYKNDIHEYPLFQSNPDKIHEPILHSPDFNPEHFLEKMNRYTTIEARDRVAQGQRTNAFRLITAFPAMFLKNYFYYGAYKDGVHGFIISLLEGISRVVRHIKIWRFSQELKTEERKRDRK